MSGSGRLMAAGLAALGLLGTAGVAEAAHRDVLAAARAFPDGGRYDKTWKGTGSPEDIVFRGATILSKGKRGSYCCGFTFAVAMRVARERKLLGGKSVGQIRRFQKEWYGATKTSREKQCALAVENLGIGSEVPLAKARPGDFVMIWRANGSGHSVVFLGWAVQGGERVGIRYRSSQRATNGIGDITEYFAGHKGRRGGIDPKRTYVARLFPSRSVRTGKPRNTRNTREGASVRENANHECIRMGRGPGTADDHVTSGAILASTSSTTSSGALVIRFALRAL